MSAGRHGDMPVPNYGSSDSIDPISRKRLLMGRLEWAFVSLNSERHPVFLTDREIKEQTVQSATQGRST
jgi:hypothetical protein